MGSLTDVAITNVRKLLYTTYLIDYNNTISTNANNTYDLDDDDEYDVHGDIYSYNNLFRVKKIKRFKKKYYGISHKYHQQYSDSKNALIDIVGNMIFTLKSEGKKSVVINQYKKFIKFIKGIKYRDYVFDIPYNDDIVDGDILYMYFKSPKTSNIEINLVKTMIDIGIVNLNYVCKKTGYGILHTYLGNMNVDIDILELLCNNGANINTQSHDRVTPLHTYMRTGNVCPVVIKKIIELGGDMNAQCVHKITPMDIYIHNVRNVNPEIINIYIESLDDYVLNIPKILHSYITLSLNIDIEVIKTFLKPNILLHYKDDAGRTCLHQYMLRHNIINTTIIKLLYDHGNSLNEPDNIGNTVLHTYLSMLSIVYITDPETSNDIKLSVIKCLILLGADLTAVNHLGYTPLTSYICTTQNYMYYDIIDCLMTDKVLEMVKHRILQDILTRADHSPYILHHIITKYNIPLDLFTGNYISYDMENIHDEYHVAILERHNDFTCETSGMIPLHVAIALHNNDFKSLDYLLSIQCNSINTLTKNGLNTLLLTLNGDRNNTPWRIILILLNKRPNQDIIISFLDKCYASGLFPILLLSKNDIITRPLTLAIMLAGIDYCNKCIGYMERDISIMDSRNVMYVALCNLVKIRDNINKLSDIYVNSSLSVYDIIVSKSYDTDSMIYKENYTLAICCFGNDPLCDIINYYITNARSTYYIVKDISKYITDTYPIMSMLPTTLLYDCIIGMCGLKFLRLTMMNEKYNDIKSSNKD
ncbi:ankyrin [Skunkpox virus]|uniref:Ankyrin n=1 Tax=Skunkpox virus TaxID=160796 RepID=A0A1C9KBH1_9POXV|nr:ankyrin [Skunkpox virus]AOP31488.1 ankyrin [Skunkpox virus]